MAAVLAYGPSTALSHRSAGALLDVRASNRTVIEVTVSGRRTRSRDGIQSYSAKLLARDVITVDGIPCTTIARTLFDLAAILDPSSLARAIERAEILREFDMTALDDVIARSNGRAGAAKLRHALSLYLPGHESTRSELEKLLLGLCDRAGLPRPQIGARIDLGLQSVEVDFLWQAERLVVETDGWEIHGTRAQFERDRRRDQLLTLAGWRVLRFTWRQLTRSSGGVAEAIRAALQQAQAAL